MVLKLGAGHTTVTLTIYAHLINDKNLESACGLEEMIFEKNGSKMVAETKKEVTRNSVTP